MQAVGDRHTADTSPCQKDAAGQEGGESHDPQPAWRGFGAIGGGTVKLREEPMHVSETHLTRLLAKAGFNAADIECILDLAPRQVSDAGVRFDLETVQRFIARAYWTSEREWLGELEAA